MRHSPNPGNNSQSGVPFHLSPADALEVLRYWLRSIKLEEALAIRPRARTGQNLSPRTINLQEPTTGQDYFKIRLGQDPDFFCKQRGTLTLPMGPELAAFFETWLAGQYRRYLDRMTEDETAMTHLAAFPIIHLSRGELAGLLRVPLGLDFFDEDDAYFKVPNHGQRKDGDLPKPPTHVRLRIDAPEDGLPFFIDTRLLHFQLGIDPDQIDDMMESLLSEATITPSMVLQTLCAVIAHAQTQTQTDERLPWQSLRETYAEQDSHGLCQSLCTLIHERLQTLGRGVRVYPVAIALDGSRGRTTWHLQREIKSLIEMAPTAALPKKSPLRAYLCGHPAPKAAGPAPRGLCPGPTPSKSQEDVLQAMLAARFLAVQGPPGTGKTTVIRHLCAHTLVEKVMHLQDHGKMGRGMIAIASTNNRAVDNAIEIFLAHDTQALTLPLALRAGNRQVCATTLMVTLDETRKWLAQSLDTVGAHEAEDDLARGLEDFASKRHVVDQAYAAHDDYRQAQARIAQLQNEIDALDTKPGQKSLDLGGAAPVMDEKRAQVLIALEERLSDGAARLSSMSMLCEGEALVQSLQKLHSHYQRFASVFAEEIPPLLDRADMHPVQLPKSPEDAAKPQGPLLARQTLMEHWEDVLEDALVLVEDRQETVQKLLAARRLRAQEQDLHQQLAQAQQALGTQPRPSSAPEHATLAQALFESALDVRQAWAQCHGERLLGAVESALGAIKQEGTLRALARSKPSAYAALHELFPIWGCTLLSIANAFPAEDDVIDRLVIDEAGQCHPAYAISALQRSYQGWILGDVHQLEPVVELAPDEERRLYESTLTRLEENIGHFRIHNHAHTSVQHAAEIAQGHVLALQEHYRCQAEIIQIADKLCDYGLNILTPKRSRAHDWSALEAPVLFSPCQGSQDRYGGSWVNRAEVDRCVNLLEQMRVAGIAYEDIAIITPYRGQLELLRRTFAGLGLPMERSLELGADGEPMAAQAAGMAVGTVHRFQGGERSVVIFSSVIRHERSLRFLNDRVNLLNVAVSRAKEHLLVLGDRDILAKGQWTRLLVDAAKMLAPKLSAF